MRTHVQILGALNIAWGVLGFIGALVVFAIFGGAMGIVGMAAHHDPGAGIAIPIIGFVGGLIFLVILITSIPSFVIGIALLRRVRWSRIAGIILSAVHLLNVPFGTALGIYGLWVLLSRDSLPLFEGTPSPVRI